MSETLSNVLNSDPIFSVIAKLFTNTAAKSIPMIPTAGTVVELGYGDAQIFGKNSSAATVWTLAVASVNASAARFIASIARINDNTGYVIAANTAGTTYYLATLNFTTGGVSSLVTVASNPVSNASFPFSAANFYHGTVATAHSLQKKANGNLALTGNGVAYYFEFTTAGAVVVDSITSTTRGVYDVVDESCTLFTLTGDLSASMNAYDKYGSQKRSDSIRIGRGASLPSSVSSIWAFGDYAIQPAVASTYQTIFKRSEIDQLIKRGILESGGRLS